jgi:hypothetical protein
VAKRVINSNINYDLMGGSFKNSPSQTIFNLGDFSVETNLSDRVVRNYNNVLGVFVEPITLENMNLTEEDSVKVSTISQKLILNYDKTDLNNYAKFGSLSEYIRISIENIILNFPASLYVNNVYERQIYNTILDYSYDQYSNTSTFRTPIAPIQNNFGLIYDNGNTQYPDGLEIRNLNLSFAQYSIFRNNNRTTEYNIIGFTGYSTTSIYFKVSGNPFSELTVTTGLTTLSTTFHVKPTFSTYNKAIKDLSDFEEFLLANKSQFGYTIKLKIPQQNDRGESVLIDTEILWPTSDGYNIDISGSLYAEFIGRIYGVGTTYDEYKSDLIYRFLTPVSLKAYDLTSDQKISKLLRVYGREFDELKRFIDSITFLNKVTYDKKNNIPDTLIKNFARVFGWNTFNLVDENDLLKRFFGEQSTEDEGALLPAEVDIELWRRIVLNTNYFWKSKGTREAIRSMFLFLGIPDSVISINEYVYTVDEKIDANSVDIVFDIPSISNPYNSDGYPISPLEDSRFYFQISGDTDGGQTYLNNFRNVGFKLNKTIDNKKSWVYTGATLRNDIETNYTQNDSRLIINTKEVDVGFDISRGIEYEFYQFNSTYNYPIASTGVTVPFLYINIPLDITGSSQSNFIIPEVQLGDIQVNINGITLAKGSMMGENDYYINPLNEQEIILNVSAYKNYLGFNDTISVTYTADRNGILTDATVKYVVTKFAVTSDGQTVFTLPKEPAGDVQLTLNGVTLTKGITALDGDYFINPSNRKEVIVKSSILGAYLKTTDTIVISYLEINDTTLLVEKYSDVFRVTSLFASNFYYDTTSNRFTYIMQYSAYDESSIKVTLNGVTLTNGVDFNLSTTNKKQIFFKAPIRIGDTINIYYYIGDSYGNTTTTYAFRDGSIVSELTFLEFINKVTEDFIDAKNRKVITDYEGGYYPTLNTLYDLYYNGLTQSGTTFLNNYNFIKLYKYLNNFNGYFQRFVSQLLPATSILKRGGIIVRNTVFTQQKFTYKSGYNGSGITDDGSEFVVEQDIDLD